MFPSSATLEQGYRLSSSVTDDSSAPRAGMNPFLEERLLTPAPIEKSLPELPIARHSFGARLVVARNRREVREAWRSTSTGRGIRRCERVGRGRSPVALLSARGVAGRSFRGSRGIWGMTITTRIGGRGRSIGGATGRPRRRGRGRVTGRPFAPLRSGWRCARARAATRSRHGVCRVGLGAGGAAAGAGCGGGGEGGS